MKNEARGWAAGATAAVALFVVCVDVGAVPSAGAQESGDVLVIARDQGPSGGGWLLLVDRGSGARIVLSDFDDPLEGPRIAWAVDVLATPGGRVFVADAAQFRGTAAIVEIAPDGSRRVLSDFDDPRYGPVGRPGRLAVTPSGTLLAIMDLPNGLYDAVLVEVDRRGRRSLVTDFQDGSQGPVLIPSDLVVRHDGSTVVLSHVTGGDAPLVEVLPDGRRRELIVTGEGAPELPVAIAESAAGSLLVLEQHGETHFGAVIEIQPDGLRSIAYDLSDLVGPIGLLDAADLALEPDGTVLVLDQEAGTPAESPGTLFARGSLLVIAGDGSRFRLTDFGNATEGPTAEYVGRMALVPERGECAGPEGRVAGARFGAAIDGRGQGARGWGCEGAGRRARLGRR